MRVNVKHEPMTHEQLRAAAPAIFATKPDPRVSERYRFIPTIKVVERMEKRGLVPVFAAQSRTQTGNANTKRHIIRFRLPEDRLRKLVVGDAVPEIILINAHNGGAIYRLCAGVFKLACLNGMVVADSTIGAIATRHMGREETIKHIVDASFEIIDRMPKLAKTISTWDGIRLPLPKQLAYARQVAKIMPMSVHLVDSMDLLTPKREVDKPGPNGVSTLWRIMNVVQENATIGGLPALNDNNLHRATRGIKNLRADMDFNKALWELTGEFAKKVA